MTQVVIDIVQDVEKMLLAESQGWIFDLCCWLLAVTMSIMRGDKDV